MSKANISADRLVSGPLPEAWNGGHEGATVRFEGKIACCTAVYNYGMAPNEKELLARRIAAALNATRNMSIEQIEAMGR